MNIELINKKELVTEYKKLLKKYENTSEVLNRCRSELSERIKELHCVYGISEITSKDTASVGSLLQNIVDLIPPAMQYPEHTVARISFENNYYITENFRETQWRLFSEIKTIDNKGGFVEVYYLDEMPEKDTGPFLNFEKDLIQSIADGISKIVERHTFFNNMLELENFNARIISNVQEGIFVTDRSFRYIVWNKFMQDLSGLASSDVIGKRPDEIFRHVLLNNTMARMKEAIKGKVITTNDAYYDIHLSGKKGWYSATYCPHISAGGEIVGIIGTIKEISKYKESEENLRDSRENLRAFASHLQTIREEERTLIAREIHDEFGQSLTALKINLSLLLPQIEQRRNDEVKSEINEMQKLLDNTIKRMRKLITELRPEVLDKLGLLEAIEHHLREFCRQTGLKFNIVNKVDTIKLDNTKQLAVFRIFQESLTNVARHSQATQVEITLQTNNALCQQNNENSAPHYPYANCFTMTIEDNGIGMDETMINSEKSFGIIGMRERAAVCSGKIQITSEVGRGTKVKVEIYMDGE